MNFRERIKKTGSSDFEGYVGDGSSDSQVVFKNGRLHVFPEDLSKIPPPLLERFGVSVYIHDNKFFAGSKNFPGYNNDLDTKINNLESKLSEAKKSGNKTEISNLEQEIQALKKQKENPDNKETKNLSPKPSYWPWIIGISLISITLGVWVVLKKRPKKQNYNNGKKK